jgi:hypothetical protein
MLPKDMVARTDTHLSSTGELVLDRTDSRIYHHLVSNPPPRDTAAQLGDFAGHVGAAPVGHFKFETGPAAPHPNIQVVERARSNAHQDLIRTVERARSNAHQDLIRTRSGVWNVSILDHVEFAMLPEIERFHDLDLPESTTASN